MASNAGVTSAVKKSIWISSMLPDGTDVDHKIKKALGVDISVYCPAAGALSGAFNLYAAKKITLFTPYATEYSGFFPSAGYITNKLDNEMHIFAPELTSVKKINASVNFFL